MIAKDQKCFVGVRGITVDTWVIDDVLPVLWQILHPCIHMNDRSHPLSPLPPKCSFLDGWR